MKVSGKCPKCDSRDIAVEGLYLPTVFQVMLRVARKVGWFPFVSKATIIRPYVCVDCGYTELYADHPEVVKPRK